MLIIKNFDASQEMITYWMLGYVSCYQIFSFQVFINRVYEVIKSVWASKIFVICQNQLLIDQKKLR